MFATVIVVLVLLAIILFAFAPKIFANGNQIASLQGCGLVLGDNGRCFADSGCGGNLGKGWDLVTNSDLGCGKGQFCCRLTNPDLYYPPGTLLIHITVQGTTTLSSTYRVLSDASGKPSLSFETGDKGTENYNTTGIPKKAALTFQYKANATEKYCTLFANENTPVQDTKDCGGGSFTTLNTVSVDYPALTNKGAKSDCGAKTCTVTVLVDRCASASDSQGSRTTFTLPFQK